MKNYSKKEDKVIINCVSKYPQNMNYAFELASSEIQRTKRAVSQRYYSKISKNNKIVAIGTKNGVVTNRKNVSIKKNVLLKEIVNNLNVKQKTELLHMLTGVPHKEIAKFVVNNF